MAHEAYRSITTNRRIICWIDAPNAVSEAEPMCSILEEVFFMACEKNVACPPFIMYWHGEILLCSTGPSSAGSCHRPAWETRLRVAKKNSSGKPTPLSSHWRNPLANLLSSKNCAVDLEMAASLWPLYMVRLKGGGSKVSLLGWATMGYETFAERNVALENGNVIPECYKHTRHIHIEREHSIQAIYSSI